MIRVGVDARPLQYPNTGIGQYTRNVLQNLAACRNLQIYLYSRDPISENPQEYPTRESRVRLLPRFLHAQLLFPIWAIADQIDVFWSPRHHLPRMLRCKSVVTIHDMVWLKHPETMKFGGAFLERLLMPPSLKKANSIICVSHATKADVLEFAPSVSEKCHVIYEASCVTLSEHRKKKNNMTPFFLFVGTKEPRKNLHNCLLAWKLSGLGDKGYKLVLAGGRGWKFDLTDTIDRLDIGESVEDISPNHEQLCSLYANCFALLQPTLYEGFGLPLVEGMTFAKPIVTSNISSMPEIAGDAALLVDPEKPREIADSIVQLATDSELYKRLSENAARRAGLFSWETAAKETETIFKSLAESIR